MPSSPGRTTEPRTVTGVGTTSGAAGLTGPALSFNKEDVGRPITGTGIPAGATLLSVTSATVATLSANATATGTVSVVLGASGAVQVGYGFTGWSPETEAESLTYSIAGGGGATAPSVMTDSVTQVTYRNR